jgi:hypothetical protein
MKILLYGNWRVSYLTGCLRYHGEGFIIAQDSCRLCGAQTTEEPVQWTIIINFWKKGRAIAQAVSRRLPTAAARLRAWFMSCGNCGRQSDTREGFLRVFRFYLPFRIQPIAPQSSSSIIWGWCNKRNSGRSTKWDHSMRKIKKRKKIKKYFPYPK